MPLFWQIYHNQRYIMQRVEQDHYQIILFMNNDSSLESWLKEEEEESPLFTTVIIWIFDYNIVPVFSLAGCFWCLLNLKWESFCSNGNVFSGEREREKSRI